MAKKITFTADQQAAITLRYQGGEWPQTIAPDFACSVGTILSALRGWAIPIRRRCPRVDLLPHELARALALYKEEKTLDEIAAALISTRVIIVRNLRKAGAVIRRRGKVQKYFTVNGTKTCAKCNLPKTCTEFSLHSSTHDGLQPTCRECQSGQHRIKQLASRFGLTQDQYNAMLASQGGVCAICKQPETRMKFGKVTALAVDHDHKTGKIRELLCHRCNVALGHFEDNPGLLEKAINYLSNRV